MGLRVFDFRCKFGHVTEHFVDSDTVIILCPECADTATRVPAAPRAKLEPFSGAFPGAADKWVRDRESHMKREQKNKAEHGTYK
jgi:hypothetical protein